MINFEKKLKDKKIFVTGHTGFTGSWACLWLQKIGSEILGYSLPSHTSPSLFKSLHLDKNVNSIYGDVCNYELIKESISKVSYKKKILIVAHRLSTIKEADNILVLNQGRIVETGNHESLLGKKQLYKKLWDVQSKN